MKVLVFPDNDKMPFSAALDGLISPEILVINEELLSDEIVFEIEEDFGLRYIAFQIVERTDNYESYWEYENSQFSFNAVVNYETEKSYNSKYLPSGIGWNIKITKIELKASFNDKKMNIKCDYDILADLIEGKFIYY